LNTRSFSFRLVAWYTCSLTAIFVLLGALLYLDLKRFLEHSLCESQARRAHQIANTLLSQIQKTGPSIVASQAKVWYEPEISDRFIRITQIGGPVIYASGAPKDASFDPAEVPSFLPSPTGSSAHTVKLSSGKLLIIAGLRYQAAGDAFYMVESGTVLDPMELNHLIRQLIIGLPFAVIIITAGGYILVRRALMPVERITRAAEQITQHNLSERLPVSKTGDELERLSVSLNRMIARLDDAFRNSKRFVADASHELRTPLTILRGELETLIEDKRLDAEARERAASMFEEAVRLTRIVEQLLTLSRLDAGEAQAEWSRFDLAGLAKTTAEQMSLLAEDKNIAVKCDASQSVEVEGDPARLKQVVVNLLDNAIKYTPSGGAVQLHVRRANGHAVLEVEDNGAGIPSDALPHVFERFYRVDQIRSGDTEGAGLGLSIVESICTAHGAVVEAESAPGKGSCFRIKLPLSRN
jgi:heavy metal sensor kinase